MFKLLKSFEMKGRGVPYFYNDDWITNGCFVIKRDLIKDSCKYCRNVPGLNQPEIERVLCFSDNPITINKTNRIYDFGFDLARVFEDQEGNEYLLSERLVSHFKLVQMNATDDCSMIYNQEQTLAIMPMRNKNPNAKRRCA